MCKFIFPLIFVFISINENLLSQDFKSVLGVPEKFLNPVDLPEQGMIDYMNSSTGPKSNRYAWRVICDREGIETFSDPNSLVKSGKKLNFKQKFFVAAERGKYIQLITINGDNLDVLNIPRGSYVEDYGWVEKSKMLLWNSGLRSENTGIYLKSLILYTVQAAQKVLDGTDKGIQVNKQPSRNANQIGNIALYDYYFVLKKENGFYLLASESDYVEPGNIIGWVSQTEQADWNTRLALEPNFNESAFDERKIRPTYQFKAYSDQISAKNHATDGSVNNSNVITKDDPVNVPKSRLAASNNKRYIGTTLRMPVLGCEHSYYYTGVLGSLGSGSTKDCPECRRALSEVLNQKENYNVLFIVEGNTSMRQFKSHIIDAVESLKKELTGFQQKFGIAFYRDADVTGDSYFSFTPLTRDIEIIRKKINDEPFTNDNYGGFSSMYSAISRSVARAGFEENSTNIIFVIGQNPDFREDPSLTLKCFDNNCKSWVKSDDLVTQLSNIRAHMVFIQPVKSKSTSDNAMAEQAEDLMLEVSKSNFSSYKEIYQLTGQRIDNPVFRGDHKTKSYIIGGSTKKIFFASGTSETMSKTDFTWNIVSPFKEIKSELDKVFDIINNIEKEDGIPEIAGIGFERGALYDKLRDVLKRAGLPATEENLKMITDRKVELYTQAFVPKKIFGSSHNLTSHVLFFPERELGDYLNDLRDIVVLRNETEDKVRTGLKNALLSIYNKYSGNKRIDKNFGVNDLFGVLHGECFDLQENYKHNFAIRNIDNPKVSYQQILNFLDDLKKTYEKLVLISKDNSYEFMFRSRGGRAGQNKYYWIPIEDTF